MLKKLKNILNIFKKEKTDVKLEDVKNRVYKSSNNMIDSNTLNQSEKELEIAKKEKTEIDSKKVSQKDRDSLADLNTNAMFNIMDIYKKR